MSGKRQKTQYSLALEPQGRGETPVSGHPRAEPFVAKPAPESPAVTEQLMEEVCDGENLQSAWKRVRRNQGSPGVDGMTIDDATGYLREHWPSTRSQLLDGTYRPQPVKRVEIPKPDGGIRKLGVPCVVDRLIQQALLQVLQERWDPTFSEHSYGFRPGRSAHQAVAQAQRYVAEGYNVVVDLDLEKFFDRVNHDILISAFRARPGHGKTRWRPQDAADGGDGVAEGRLVFVIPGGGMGTDNSAGFLHQSMRPDSDQRVESEQCRCRAQDGQVRPLPLCLDAQMFTNLLEGCLDPPAGHEKLKDRGGFEVKVGAKKRLRVPPAGRITHQHPANRSRGHAVMVPDGGSGDILQLAGLATVPFS